MGKESKALTVEDLLARLDAQDAQIAALKAENEAAKEAAKAAAPPDAVQLEILKTLKELRASNVRAAPQFYTGPELKKTPYDGYVRATEACITNLMDHEGNVHPIQHAEGEVFQVDLDQLWSDDPFVPVILKGYEDIAQTIPITEPNKDAVVANHRFRRHTSNVDDPSLKRASEY